LGGFTLWYQGSTKITSTDYKIDYKTSTARGLKQMAESYKVEVINGGGKAINTDGFLNAKLLTLKGVTLHLGGKYQTWRL
jgi:hypothetical protein